MNSTIVKGLHSSTVKRTGKLVTKRVGLPVKLNNSRTSMLPKATTNITLDGSKSKQISNCSSIYHYG